jgi:tetratricopeptide (TPR) repeat protein
LNFFAILIYLSTASLPSQAYSSIDEVNAELKQAKTKQDSAWAYYHRSMYFLFIDEDSTVLYSKMTEKMAQQTEDYYLLGKIYQNYAFLYQANPDFYDKALEYYYLAQGNYVKKQDYKKVAEILTGIGELYEFNTEFEIAIENYNRAIERLESVKDNASIADLKFQISRTQLKMSRTSAALASMEEAIALWEKEKQPEKVYEILEQQYQVHLKDSAFSLVKETIERMTAISLRVEAKDNFMGKTVLYKANLEYAMGNMKASKSSYQRAREMAEGTAADLNILSNALYGIARIERDRDSLQIALELLFEAEENYTRTSTNREGIIKVYDQIVDIFFAVPAEEKNHLLEQYTKWLDLYVTYEQDKALVEKKSTNFSILQGYIDRQQEQFQNPAQEARNIVWIVVSLILASVASFFAIFFYRRYYKEQQVLAKQRKALEKISAVTNKKLN